MRALADPQPVRASSETIAALLADWFRDLPSLGIPWLRATSRWQVLSAERVLGPSDAPERALPLAAAGAVEGT